MEMVVSAGVLNVEPSFSGHAWLNIVIISAEGFQSWAHHQEMIELIYHIFERE